MLSLILIIPFFNFLFCTILGGNKLISENGIRFIVVVFMFTTLTLTFTMFFNNLNSEITMSNYFCCWFNINILDVTWGISINKITCVMLLLVISISCLVHVFSLNYMAGEPHLSRFIGYLSLFTFFMLVLIVSPNLIQLFIGWEGVGVCSYLLINFWYTRVLASQSAFKAMAVNKIGDVSFLMALGLIFYQIGTCNINIINSTLYSLNNYNTLINLLLLIAVTGKSAQLGLHMWLPDAMEGPTPVSALIHAATMVTAGVFLIIKLSPIFFINNTSNIIIMSLGAFTCLLAASIGISQNDLKKVIAYSTCSQLGYMVLVCGYGYYNVSLFHLFNHGIFKALLFLSAGLVIHSLMNEQTLLRMGLVRGSFMGKYGLYMGSIAIVGFPFFTGFYSKDLLLELLAAQSNLIYPLWLGYIAASLTCYYSLRSLYLSYNTKNTFSSINSIIYHENSLFLLVPLLILSIGSIVMGYTLNFSILSSNNPIIVSNFTKFFPLIISFVIILVVFIIINTKTFYSKIIKKFLINTWYFNELTNSLIIKYSKYSFSYSYKLIDSQILEYLSPTGISRLVKTYSSWSGSFSINLLPKILSTLVWAIMATILLL